MKSKYLAIILSICMVFASLMPGFASAAPGNSGESKTAPGQVRILKELTDYDETSNTWGVKLTIDAADAEKLSSVVLVLDMSESMNLHIDCPNKDKTRLELVKEAAAAFTEQMLSDSKSEIEIAVVAVNEDDQIVSAFKGADEKDSLLADIDSLTAGGSANIQSGIHAAKELLSEKQTGKTSIILLGDNLPTISDPVSADADIESEDRGFYEEDDDMLSDTDPQTEEENNVDIRLYSIAFQPDMVDENVSEGGVGEKPDDYYVISNKETEDILDSLSDIFDQIAEKLGCVGEYGCVTDSTGEIFQIADANCDGMIDVNDVNITIGTKTLSEAEKLSMADIKENDEKIQKPVAEIDMAAQVLTVNGLTVREDENSVISYRVGLREGIAPEEGASYLVSGDACFTYVDYAGNFTQQQSEALAVSMTGSAASEESVEVDEEETEYLDEPDTVLFVRIEEKYSLTIQTDGIQDIDENQSLLFQVEYKALETDEWQYYGTAAIQGDSSWTFADIPVGFYRITEQEDWSWRYAVDGQNGKTVEITGQNPSQTVQFVNQRIQDKWLGGDSAARSISVME